MNTKLLSFLALTTATFGFASSLPVETKSSQSISITTQARPPLYVHPFVTASPSGYSPAQVRHAYGVDLLSNGGSGQVIAIVDAYGSPTAQTDLNIFSTTYSLPQTTITTVYGSSKPRSYDQGWALETSLDLQWAHAIAPNAKIVLAVAASASLNDLLAAVNAAKNAGATVISMSWGASEFASETYYESYFQKTGVTFVASSGDNGAGAEWPACSPSVVGVGGTTLYLDSSGNLTTPETAWSGSGGGVSSYFSRPTYQAGWQSSSKRQIPDVSMIANPNTGVSVYDSYGYYGMSGWFTLGGTSASAPMWGAVIALTNELRKSAGLANLTGSNTALYSLAGSVNSSGTSLYSYYFFDVTSGSNGFSATAKYDEVTGLGTPVVPNIAAKLGR